MVRVVQRAVSAAACSHKPVAPASVNRLASVTYSVDGGSGFEEEWQVDYYYDANNRLVRRVDDVQQTEWPNFAGSDTIFTYENGQILLAFEVLGTQTQRFVWGPNTDQLLATEYTPGYYGGGHIYFPLADAQGTIHDAAKFFLADAQTQTYVTQVVMHRFIDAFGRDLDMDLFTGHHFGTGVSYQPYAGPLFLFTGRYRDPLTGLQNNWHRWYNPEVGRWMTEDPIGLRGGDANLYRYVKNRPLQFADPTGLFWEYGNWCGPFNYGQKGGPIDALDKACQIHDMCLATWREFITPLRRRCCDAKLCVAAVHALVVGCSTSPTPWACRIAADEVQTIMCNPVVGTFPLPFPW